MTGDKDKGGKKRRIFLYLPIVLLLVLVPVVLLVIVGYFYLSPVVSSKVKFLYRYISLPIVVVQDEDYIYSKELYDNLVAVKRFYNSNDYSGVGRVDFSTKQGRFRLHIKEKDILDKLIEDRLVTILAKKRMINVSDKEVNEAVEKSLLKNGSNYNKLRLSLLNSYGWTVDDFKNKIVRNQLYYDKLFHWYVERLQQGDEYLLMKDIHKELLQDGGANFDKVVARYKDRIDNENDLIVPWVNEKDIIPEVAHELESMKKGDVSKIIISPLGFHIVKLIDSRGSDQNSGKEFYFKHIFVRGFNFIDWLQGKKKKIKVRIFLPEYKWDNQLARVVFGSGELNKKEKVLRLESEGDPSI